MYLDLSGKNAIVCGASQGLGLACAQELALLGTSVILVARNQQKLDAAKESLSTNSGQQHQVFVADFENLNEIEALAQWLSQQNVHILVNNTGGPAGGKLLEADPQQFAKAFQMHVLANQILTQAVVPFMKTAQFGRIINISSISVISPISGLGVSNTIRAAVSNWSKTMAMELGPFGITVNNVLPGFHATERLEVVLNNKAKATNTNREFINQQTFSQIPLGRFGEAAEFAAVVAFLCSPAASYVTGVNLPVDGGKVAGSL